MFTRWCGGYSGTPGFWSVTGVLLGLFLFALAVIAMVVLVVWLLRQRKPESNVKNTLAGSALDILERRYARGEIDAESYERMKRELGP